MTDAPAPTDWTAERITALRMRLGISREAFARRVGGVSATTVVRWERRGVRPQTLSVAALDRLDAETRR